LRKLGAVSGNGGRVGIGKPEEANPSPFPPLKISQLEADLSWEKGEVLNWAKYCFRCVEGIYWKSYGICPRFYSSQD
jgi:hypothetical protein